MLKRKPFFTLALVTLFSVLLAATTTDYAFATGEKETLLDAARDGKMAKIEDLLAKGADINVQNAEGWTPLMFAVAAAHTKLTKLLLEKGADVNIKTKKGWTPLMIAAKHNDVEMMKLLLEKGAYIHDQNEDGKTALMLAEEQDHKDAIKFLKGEGAK